MKTVALFFGGPSNEHEVSILSARNIVHNFPNNRYELKLVYWQKNGNFRLLKSINNLKKGKQIYLQDFKNIFNIAFPITHGRQGEDGILQSLFESQKIKYCGCRVLSSALCMDKGSFKNYLAGKINQVKFISLDYQLNSPKEISTKLAEVKKHFNLPLYIKPANSGSSVGISRIDIFPKLKSALDESLKHDTKIIIEEGLVNPRELEVAILGNQELIVSAPGELKLVKDFYNYDDKYKLGQVKVIIPAKITGSQSKKIRALAKEAYRALGCSGFARVDFFISKGKVYLNEINTLPGFTDISMYPMLMASSGINYRNLILKIIKLAY